MDSCWELQAHRSSEITLGIFCSVEIKAHSARIKLLDDSSSFFVQKLFMHKV